MKKMFALMGLVALFAVSCEAIDSVGPNNPNNPNTPEEPATPEIVVDVDGIIAVPAAGGDVELGYEIVNPVEGTTLEAVADVNWVTNVAVAEKITISVAANDGASRIGVVTLTYGEVQVALAIQQTEFLAEGVARLSITSDLKVSVVAEGASGKITYLLECEEQGAVPTVTADVAWITVDAVEAKRVKYTVQPNNVEERRVGHITLSYEDATADVTFEQEAAVFYPILTASSTTVKLNETIEFKVMYGDKDVTADAAILTYYTNENVGPTFVAKVLGEHYIYATYNNRESKVLPIYVSPENAPEFPEDTAPDSFDFNQRFLLVDHTGVDCPNCPLMKTAIKGALESDYYKNKFNVVYAYSYTTSDICYSQSSDKLWEYYVAKCRSLTGFPSATINYQYVDVASANTLLSHIKNAWTSNPSASVALSVEIEDNQLVASVAVKSSKAQDIKLSLWVLEDDIYAKQSGTSETWMYDHHNVLRECPTGISNKDISGIELGKVEENGILRKVVGYNLNPTSINVVENYKVIAIISAPNSKYNNQYEVVNTAICEVGGSIGFDYKQ